MNRKYLLGTAVAALVAASGPAFAADPMPAIVVATPIEVPAVDPLTIDIVAGLGAFFEPGDDYRDIAAFLAGEVTYKTAAGWGLDVDFGGGVDLDGDANGFGEATFELYRSFGAFGVGFIFGAVVGSFEPAAYGFGPTLRYETDSLTVHAALAKVYYDGLPEGYEFDIEAEFEADKLTIGVEAYAEFDGGLDWFNIVTAAAYDVTERLTLHGAVAYSGPGGGGGEFEAALAAQMHFGSFSPFAVIVFDGNTDYIFGVELDHQLGDGPFALIGNASVDFTPGFNTQFEAAIGIRFRHGDVDGSPFDLFEIGSP